MEIPDRATPDTSHQPVQSTPIHSQGIWGMPVESAVRTFLNNRDAVGRFLGLTGGSLLYGLSALSIVYGITQIIGPPLAKSNALGDILPCVAMMSSWSFVLLAFLLLFLGAAMSLFVKLRLLSESRPCTEPVEEGPAKDLDQTPE